MAMAMLQRQPKLLLFSLVSLLALLFAPLLGVASARSWIQSSEPEIHLPSEEDEVGTRWAVLVAGSSGFDNYRHQADVCHAYQIFRKGGLKDENIVVFMYDDIATNPMNPRPGMIINHPNGSDVYAGVPKDYTGKHVNTKNFFAVLLGDKSEVNGGSGKVVDSKPGDRIFIYYTDHGGPGVLGMPSGPFILAGEFIKVLKKKHKLGTYKEMVIYVEACQSGSIFEGMMPKDLDIYVTTASNAVESSFGTYCPGMVPPPPPEFLTCLGDLYSVAWMEDSESHNLKKETIKKQYHNVKLRTSNYNKFTTGSHVMEYGSTDIKSEKLYLYQGFNPDNANLTDDDGLHHFPAVEAVDQRDADLLFLWQRYKHMDERSEEKAGLLKEITDTMLHRVHIDDSIKFIGKLLFGSKHGPSILKEVRPHGQPLVDDWDCLKKMVGVFEEHCGSLTQYGMKHMRAFANICNNEVTTEAMEEACVSTCRGYATGFVASAGLGISV